MVDMIGKVLQQWISPAGLLLLLGAIVWGIQLNAAALDHAASIAEHKKDLEEHSALLAAQNVMLAEIKLTLSQVSASMASMDKHIEVHNREATKWKQRIIRNEERLRSMAGD